MKLLQNDVQNFVQNNDITVRFNGINVQFNNINILSILVFKLLKTMK